MRWSKLLIPTLREEPSEAGSAGRRLLVRAGYFRRENQLLYLGCRSIRKIESAIETELDRVGAQAIGLPEPSASSAATLAQGELRSYKQLPQIWRLEKELAGWTIDSEDKGRAVVADACRRAMDRFEVPYWTVEGKRPGQEFFIPMESGEESVLTDDGGYRARIERAVSVLADLPLADPEGLLEPEEFYTPGRKTVAEVAEFTGLPETSQIKSLVVVADGEPLLVLVRGDHTLAESKLDAETVRPATGDEILKWFGAEAGSLGPVGIKSIRIVADHALEGRQNMICGANRNDYHLRNVTPGKDFACEFRDVRRAVAGAGFREHRGVPVAWFTSCREKDSPCVLDSSGKEIVARVSEFRFSAERLLLAAAELFADKDGLVLPPALAPFAVVVTPVAPSEAAETLYAELLALGVDAILDDRDERPGVKFKDADLIGIPRRITLGKKLADGKVELVERKTKTIQDVPLVSVARLVAGKEIHVN